MEFLRDKYLFNEAVESYFEATVEQKQLARAKTDKEKEREKKEKELDDASKAQQDKLKQDANSESQPENKPATSTGKTAADVVKENSTTISSILWRFLSQPRRKALDKLFYNELQKNSLFIAPLNVSDNDFKKALAASNSKLAQDLKKDAEQNPEAEQQAPEEKPNSGLQGSLVKPTDAEFNQAKKTLQKQDFEPEDFEAILTEALLGDIGKWALGLKPAKVKEIQLNGKAIYNNAVLILLIESYLMNVMTAFAKQNNIKIDRDRYSDDAFTDSEDPKDQDIIDLADTLGLDPVGLRDHIKDLKYIKSLKKSTKQSEENDAEIKTTQQRMDAYKAKVNENDKEKYATIIAAIRKAKLVTNESIIQNQEVITEVVTMLKNFFREKFKVVELEQVNNQQFIYYCNYLFSNKQFFIQQTKLLNKYASTYSQTYGLKFYQILADFNSLDVDTRAKLVESSFSDEGNFNHLFEDVFKVAKVLAITITRDIKKQTDNLMPGAYRAGVKVGEFLGRLKSGQSAATPLDTKEEV